MGPTSNSDKAGERLSQRPGRPQHSPNEFYRAFEEELHEILLADYMGSPAQAPWHLYTTRRLGEGSSSAWALFADELGIEPSEAQRVAGPAEFRLLRFLTSKSRVGLLYVRCHVGTGKTSLVKYVAHHAIRQLGLERRIQVAVMDCGADHMGSVKQRLVSRMRASLRDLIGAYGESERAPLKILDAESTLEAARGMDDRGSEEALREAMERLAIPTEYPQVALVFDNVDQLDSDDISIVVGLACTAWQAYGIRCVVTLRPTTYHEHAQNEYTRGAFLFQILELSPPDLRSLLRYRVEAARERIHTAATRMRDSRPRRASRWDLSTNSLWHAVHVIFKRLLNPEVQRLLYQLSDYQVRASLVLVDRYIRAVDLRPGPILLEVMGDAASPERHELSDEEIGSSDSGDAAHHESKSPHRPLELIMRSSWRAFTGDKSVPNVFETESPGRRNRAIDADALAILKWFGEMTPLRRVVSRLCEIGYPQNSIRPIIKKLRDSHLIFISGGARVARSDESQSASYDGLACCTSKGEFFLTRLVADANYILHASDDCTLPRSTRFGSTDATSWSFPCRLERVISLWREVVLEDLNKFRNRPGRPVSVELFSGSPLLSERMRAPVMALAERSAHSEFEHVRLALDQLNPELKRIEQAVRRLRLRIGRYFQASERAEGARAEHRRFVVTPSDGLEIRIQPCPFSGTPEADEEGLQIEWDDSKLCPDGTDRLPHAIHVRASCIEGDGRLRFQPDLIHLRATTEPAGRNRNAVIRQGEARIVRAGGPDHGPSSVLLQFFADGRPLGEVEIDEGA